MGCSQNSRNLVTTSDWAIILLIVGVTYTSPLKRVIGSVISPVIGTY